MGQCMGKAKKSSYRFIIYTWWIDRKTGVVSGPHAAPIRTRGMLGRSLKRLATHGTHVVRMEFLTWEEATRIGRNPWDRSLRLVVDRSKKAS